MGHLTNDNKIKKLIADIPTSLHNRFKAHCSKKGLTMKEALEKLINQEIEKEETKKPIDRK